jgi:hypothetical protein
MNSLNLALPENLVFTVLIFVPVIIGSLILYQLIRKFFLLYKLKRSNWLLGQLEDLHIDQIEFLKKLDHIGETFESFEDKMERGALDLDESQSASVWMTNRCTELKKEKAILEDRSSALASSWPLKPKFQLGPEKISILLSFFLPRKIRQTSFEPYMEELKEDRLEARRKIHSQTGKVWVEFCFYFRLIVAFLQSLVCWARDFLSKASPILKWILGS